MTYQNERATFLLKADNVLAFEWEDGLNHGCPIRFEKNSSVSALSRRNLCEMPGKKSKSVPTETKEDIRERILSDADQFFEELPRRYTQMERRGRKALWRSLGEAAVLVKVAQERSDILERIPTEDKTVSKKRRNREDTLVKDVVYLMMQPVGKDEITKASKYITTIRYMMIEDIEGDEFVDAMKEMGGIESVCKKARKKEISGDHEKIELDICDNITKSNRKFPKMNKEFLEGLAHVDMGDDAERFYEAKTVVVRLHLKGGATPSGWKDITGEIMEVEE